jgi:hypothetical protein
LNVHRRENLKSRKLKNCVLLPSHLVAGTYQTRVHRSLLLSGYLNIAALSHLVSSGHIVTTLGAGEVGETMTRLSQVYRFAEFRTGYLLITRQLPYTRANVSQKRFTKKASAGPSVVD